MIHGIDTHDRVEGFVVKWQTLIYIRQLEFGICYPGIKCLLICSLNSFLIDIQPCDTTLEFLCKVEGRPARPAGYFKDVVAGGEIEPVEESIILISRDPTVLTDILSISFLPNFF